VKKVSFFLKIDKKKQLIYELTKLIMNLALNSTDTKINLMDKIDLKKTSINNPNKTMMNSVLHSTNTKIIFMEGGFPPKTLKKRIIRRTGGKWPKLIHIQQHIKNELKEMEYPLCVIEYVWDNLFSIESFCFQFWEYFIDDVLFDKIKVKYDEWKEEYQDTEEEEYEESSTHTKKMVQLKDIQEHIKFRHKIKFPLCVIEQVWDNLFCINEFIELLFDEIKYYYWDVLDDFEEANLRNDTKFFINMYPEHSKFMDYYVKNDDSIDWNNFHKWKNSNNPNKTMMNSALHKTQTETETETKNLQIKCNHRWECGCGKPSCLEMDGEDCDDECSNEGCRHYYDHRNDNCDCHGKDCGYCVWKELHYRW